MSKVTPLSKVTPVDGVLVHKTLPIVNTEVSEHFIAEIVVLKYLRTIVDVPCGVSALLYTLRYPLGTSGTVIFVHSLCCCFNGDAAALPMYRLHIYCSSTQHTLYCTHIKFTSLQYRNAVVGAETDPYDHCNLLPTCGNCIEFQSTTQNVTNPKNV